MSEVNRWGLMKWLHDGITVTSSFIFLLCPHGLKTPPEGSRNIFILQPRKRERMNSKGHMSAESFSFYLGHACFYPIAQNWHTGPPIDIKELWDCEVCLTRYMAFPEFYQLERRVNGLGIGNWWCLLKTCYNPNKYDCMMLESVLVSFFYKWLTSFPSTTC